MRITFTMQATRSMASISSSLSSIADAQDKVNLKRNLLNPEDNASNYIAAYSVQRMIDDVKQFSVNGQNASKWLTDADNALQEAMKLVSQAKNEFAIGGNTDSNDADSRASMAEHVKEVYNTLMDLANTQSMGQYLFSGFATTTKPFQTGANQVSSITSVTRNGGEVSVMEVFSDLPELKTGSYTATITVNNGIATLEIDDNHANKIILDSNGTDESGGKGNGSSTKLTFEYVAGAVIDTGRGVSFKMPDTNETQIKLNFDYRAGSEMNYAGDGGSILTQIGYNQDIAINVPGEDIFSQSYKTLMGTKTNTVNGLPATLTSFFSQLDGGNANIGDSIKISGTDHTGNIVGAAEVLSATNPKLDLTNTSEKERTLLIGYADKMYKIVIPEGAYPTGDELATAINTQLKYAEYLDNISIDENGFESMDHYTTSVQVQMENGKFFEEVRDDAKTRYETDLSSQIKITTDGDRLQFSSVELGDNVRLTVSGHEDNLLGFRDITVGAEGKDTVFEIGYEFNKESVEAIKTTHEGMDLTGTNYTFYLNGEMINITKPATQIQQDNLTNITYPTGAGDADLVLRLGDRDITIPAEDFDGTDATALAVINEAIAEAGIDTDFRVTAVDTANGTMTIDVATPSAKEIEYSIDEAIRAAGLGFSFGAEVTQTPGEPLGTYNVSFTMNNGSLDRNTQLNSVFYNLNTNPPSSEMKTALPNRMGIIYPVEHSLDDLASFIKDLYDDSVNVTMENGKMVVKDIRSGESKLAINLTALNQGISNPPDQATVMGGKYTGTRDDNWNITMTSIITNSDQRDIRIRITNSNGVEIHNMLVENYLGGEIDLPHGVTITPNIMGLIDPADPNTRERTTNFAISLTAKGNIGFGDMNVTEQGKNVNIFRSLQNLENALKYNITKNGFSQPSAWKDTSLSSTSSPYFDGTFKGMSNDLWTFETLSHNGKNNIFIQNEYTERTGEIKYNQNLINNLGSNIEFSIDVYDNITGTTNRIPINIDLSNAIPDITDSVAAKNYILKELNNNIDVKNSGLRFVDNEGKIEMQSGSGTKIATFANTATGDARALTNNIMGFSGVTNMPLNDDNFPLTLQNAAVFNVEDVDANDTAADSPIYPYRAISVAAGTYDSKEDLLAAVNTALNAAEPDGTNGRIIAVLDATGAIQFEKADGSYVETTVAQGADNPLNIALKSDGATNIFATSAQSPQTDLSAINDEGRTLTINYTEGNPPQQRSTVITLDKRPYESNADIVGNINEKLAAQGIPAANMEAVLNSNGCITFVSSNNNFSSVTVQGDENATLGFVKAGDEARIKITSGYGHLIQEVTVDTAGKTVHVANGLYLGYDKGYLKATDAFTGAVGSGIDSEITVLEQAERQVLEAITLVGNRGSRVESVAKFQETLTTAAENNKANYLGSTDIDQVKAATELQMAKTAYEAALASSSTIISISLLDFLS